jgi:hypothetical protein
VQQQSRPQEAGQALWSKVQVGLRAAIDDARRRGSSGGDVFTLAQAQEKHTLALRSQNDSFTFRQYGAHGMLVLSVLRADR